MIKFIELPFMAAGAKNHAFAFLNTHTWRFFEFNANQVWNSRAEFIRDHKSFPVHDKGKELHNFLSVMPHSIK